MIVSKGLESSFKGIRVDIKLKVLNNRDGRQLTRFMVFGDVKDYLAFMSIQ
jgi:hypothetical protein